MHQISRCNFQYPRNFSQRKLRDFCNPMYNPITSWGNRFVFRKRLTGKWDTNALRKVCERCHTSSLHSRWQTSPTLLGATARSCREQCRQTTAGSRIVHHPTKSGLGATVSKLVPGMCRLFEAGACFFLPSPFLASHAWELVRSLAGYIARYRREHVLPRRVNCSGEDRKLSVPSVILSGTSAAVSGRVSRPTKVLQ